MKRTCDVPCPKTKKSLHEKQNKLATEKEVSVTLRKEVDTMTPRLWKFGSDKVDHYLLTQIEKKYEWITELDRLLEEFVESRQETTRRFQ